MLSHAFSYDSVITVDGKLLASNNNGQKIVGVAGKHVENEAISAVLANTFADFENTDGKDTDSETKDSVSTKRLVLEVEGGCFFVSRVCADFLVGCHVLRSSGISMEEATRQVRLSLSLSLSTYLMNNSFNTPYHSAFTYIIDTSGRAPKT